MTTKKARATAKKATRQQRRQRRSSKSLGGGGDQGAGFEETVGVEGEAVVDVELDGEFVVAGGGHETERERRGDVELVVVEEGWEVAGVGDGAGSVGVEAQDEAGDEAVLETVVQAAV